MKIQYSTVCSKNIALHFHMKKVRVFLLSIFMKFNLHPSIHCIWVHIKLSKNPPRLATLINSHFGKPGPRYLRAHYTVLKKTRKHDGRLRGREIRGKYLCMRAITNRGAAARGGWWPHTSHSNFFYFWYIFIYSIGTCI